MQSLFAMVTFMVTAAVLQFVGFLISRLVEMYWPAAGLLTFLIIFIAAYGLAWPIAVRIAEFLIVRAGFKLAAVDPRAT